MYINLEMMFQVADIVIKRQQFQRKKMQIYRVFNLWHQTAEKMTKKVILKIVTLSSTFYESRLTLWVWKIFLCIELSCTAFQFATLVYSHRCIEQFCHEMCTTLNETFQSTKRRFAHMWWFSSNKPRIIYITKLTMVNQSVRTFGCSS